jgi:hypothetical protein
VLLYEAGGAQIMCTWSLGPLNFFFAVVRSIFSIIVAFFPSTYKSMYQFTCTKQNAPCEGEVYSWFESYGFWIWNVFYVTFLAFQIWRWLTLLKIYGRLCEVVELLKHPPLFGGKFRRKVTSRRNIGSMEWNCKFWDKKCCFLYLF